ncbi:MAG: small subunit ribosomal protein S16 [Flavobacteriales bacterium]|jgi:small subunit ribosomal protein S16
MATKLRLQRHGKKGRPFYHIVAADARAKRDGRFIEKLGTYNPCTNPATIELDSDKALDWILKGAQPTDTVKALLSYKGVMFRKHLAKGVLKGALTQEQADAKYTTWSEAKAGIITAKVDSLSKAESDAAAKALAAEKAINDARAKEIAAANAPVVEEAPATEEEAPVTEEEAPAAEEDTKEE